MDKKKDLLYIDDARRELKRYAELQEKITALEKEIKQVREKFRKWLIINNIKPGEHVELDDYIIQLEVRKTVKYNDDLIKLFLDPEKYYQVVTESISDPYVRITKKRGKNNKEH